MPDNTPPSASYLRACREERGLSLRAAGDLLAKAGWSKSQSAARDRLNRLELGKTGVLNVHQLSILRDVLGVDPVVLLHLYMEEEPSAAAVEGLDRAVCTWAFMHLEEPGVMEAWVTLTRARKTGGAYYLGALHKLHSLSEEVSDGVD